MPPRLRTLTLTLTLFAMAVVAQSARGQEPVAAVPPKVAVRVLISKLQVPTILQSRLPEGTVVAKGDVVAILDDAALQDNLVNQQISEERARADFADASRSREVAEISISEYQQFPSRPEAEILQSAVEIARDELTLVQDELSEAEAAEDPDPKAIRNVRLAVRRSALKVKQAEFALKFQRDQIEPVKIAALKTRLEETQIQMLAKQAAAELEHARTAKLLARFDELRIVAPFAGIVIHPLGTADLVDGATVEPGRVVVRIVELPATPITRLDP